MTRYSTSSNCNHLRSCFHRQSSTIRYRQLISRDSRISR